MKIGYARISTATQKSDRQIDQLKEAGCDRIYSDTISGTKYARPGLDELIKVLREGDTVVVVELTRLSRSVKDLITLADIFKDKKVELRSLSEKDSWIDTETASGKMIFTMMAALSQFERDLTVQRTREGLTAARARGNVGGRKEKLDEEQKIWVRSMLEDQNKSVTEIAAYFKVSRPTIYRVLEEGANNRKGERGNAQ
jgi:DNA invertase Pin-like site-specific DNA recombinase